MTDRILGTAIPFLMFIGGSSKAVAHGNDEIIRRELKVEIPFQKLVIDADVDVLLTEDSSTQILIEGEMAAVSAVKITIENGVLKIASRKAWRNERTLVYIPVHFLRSIEVLGDANVTSSNLLHSTHLDILVNGNCEINIRVRGAVNVNCTDNYRVDYLKNERIRIVNESQYSK